MGGSHIAIPTILKVGKGTLENLGTYIKSSGMSNAVIYFGNDLIDMFGETVMKSLKDAGVNVLGYREMDSIKIEELIGIAFDIDSKAQVVVGIGGGKVIDGAKYAAYLRKLPFISVPTSASSDGFSSASASLLVNGRRTSVPARMAYGIVADTHVDGAGEQWAASGKRLRLVPVVHGRCHDAVDAFGEVFRHMAGDHGVHTKGKMLAMLFSGADWHNNRL